MAEARFEETQEEVDLKKSIAKRVIRILGLLLLLVMLICAGFFVGIYLRIFDVHEINEKMRLYDLPVFGEYFVRPPGQPGEDEKEPVEEPVIVQDSKQANSQQPKAEQKQQETKPIVVTQEAIEKQRKEKAKAEKKRVARLARLYAEMKPKAAADIMDGLNEDITIAILQQLDDSQAAKILAEFNPEKSARLTRTMYLGITSRLTSPGDSQGSEIQPVRMEE